MQLHRPKALEDLNIDFFSGETERNDEPLEEKEAYSQSSDFSTYLENDTFSVSDETENVKKSPQLPKKAPDEPYSTDEILTLLAEDFSALDELATGSAFTSSTVRQEDGTSDAVQEESHIGETVPLVDEKTVLESFPDISTSILDLAAKPQATDDPKKKEKDAIKRAKEDAKASIENEKKKIKEQKNLEKTVQRPFGKRRVAIFLMVVFLVIGILASAALSLAYAVEKTDDGMLDVAGLTVTYVDGSKIEGDEHIGEYIVFKSGRIQGNDTLLFLDSAGTPTVADVIGFGDGLYAVNLASSVYRVEQSKILGCAKLKTPMLAVVRNAVSGYSFVVFAVLAIYLILVILFSSLRIGKLNSAIRKLEENYELI